MQVIISDCWDEFYSRSGIDCSVFLEQHKRGNPLICLVVTGERLEVMRLRMKKLVDIS